MSQQELEQQRAGAYLDIWQGGTTTLYVSLKLDQNSKTGQEIVSRLTKCNLNTSNIHISLMELRFPTIFKDTLLANDDFIDFITNKFQRCLQVQLYSARGNYKRLGDYLTRDYTDNDSYAPLYREFLLQVVHKAHEMLYGVWPDKSNLKLVGKSFNNNNKELGFKLLVSSLLTVQTPQVVDNKGIPHRPYMAVSDHYVSWKPHLSISNILPQNVRVALTNPALRTHNPGAISKAIKREWDNIMKNLTATSPFQLNVDYNTYTLKRTDNSISIHVYTTLVGTVTVDGQEPFTRSEEEITRCFQSQATINPYAPSGTVPISYLSLWSANKQVPVQGLAHPISGDVDSLYFSVDGRPHKTVKIT